MYGYIAVVALMLQEGRANFREFGNYASRFRLTSPTEMSFLAGEQYFGTHNMSQPPDIKLRNTRGNQYRILVVFQQRSAVTQTLTGGSIFDYKDIDVPSYVNNTYIDQASIMRVTGKVVN
ncbi:hypothetical protein BJ912DRAFT_927334 [Pholiota molesta]|nr:hypothetical protein BJ912DRAFT_927334 [Pholiota molesta]